MFIDYGQNCYNLHLHVRHTFFFILIALEKKLICIKNFDCLQIIAIWWSVAVAIFGRFTFVLKSHSIHELRITNDLSDHKSSGEHCTVSDS